MGKPPEMVIGKLLVEPGHFLDPSYPHRSKCSNLCEASRRIHHWLVTVMCNSLYSKACHLYSRH